MSLLDKLEEARKASPKTKERLVAIITIAAMAIITVVWFLFTLSSFFKTSAVPTASTTPSQGENQATSTSITPPFAL